MSIGLGVHGLDSKRIISLICIIATEQRCQLPCRRRRQTSYSSYAMGLLRLLVFSTALVGVSCSPIAVPEGQNERREPLNLDAGSGSSPMDTVVIGPLPSRGCTTTLSETYGYPCVWSGTETIYPSTVIGTKQVNCNGCDVLSVDKEYYFCPNQVITATEWAKTPSTFWTTVCKPSATAAKRQERVMATGPGATSTVIDGNSPVMTPPPRLGNQAGVKDLRDAQPAACSTTYVVQPEKSAGKTLTSYASYTTTTATLNCHGCSLSVSTALAGYGPPGVFTKTTTLPIGTTTVYVCP